MHSPFYSLCVFLVVLIPLLSLSECRADSVPDLFGQHAELGNTSLERGAEEPMKRWAAARKRAEIAQEHAIRIRFKKEDKMECKRKYMKKVRDVLVHRTNHEKKMRELRIWKLKNNLKKKKEAMKARYARLKKPEDVFSFFPNSFMNRAKEKFSTEELVQYVQTVLKTAATGKKLRRIEKIALRSARKGIMSVLFTPNCGVFFSKMYGELSVCCRVVVEPNFFGLCTPLRLLQLKREAMHELVRGKMKHISEEVKGQYLSMSVRYGYGHSSSYRGYSSSTSLWGRSHPQVSIDLFAVPCYPVIDNGLCSQYVRLLSYLSLSFTARLMSSNYRVYVFLLLLHCVVLSTREWAGYVLFLVHGLLLRKSYSSLMSMAPFPSSQHDFASHFPTPGTISGNSEVRI